MNAAMDFDLPASGLDTETEEIDSLMALADPLRTLEECCDDATDGDMHPANSQQVDGDAFDGAGPCGWEHEDQYDYRRQDANGTSISCGNSDSTILRPELMTAQSEPFADPRNAITNTSTNDEPQLPILEHQQIDYDIQPSTALPEETEEFLCTKLDEMEVELSKIVSKLGFEMAMQSNPEYAQSRPLRAMFLRSESYDAERAARRFVGWYDSILVHFGPEALGRPLRLTDLSAEAYHLLTLGKFQLLPLPDSEGRYILAFYKNTSDLYSDHAAAQLLHYISSTAYNCSDIQRNGVISVHRFDVVPGTPQENISPDMYRLGKITHLLPLRVEKLHYVGNLQHHRNQAVIDKVHSSVATEFRDRFQVHLGSTQKGILDELSTYGIPSEFIPPVDSAGDLLSSYHMDWVMQQKIMEGLGILTADSILRYNNRNLDQLFIRTRMNKTITGGAQSDFNKDTHSTISEPDMGTMVSDEASTASSTTATTSSSSSSSSASSAVTANSANSEHKDDDDSDLIIPTDGDVLMGRGRPYLHHPGNKYLRSMVADRSKEYDTASRAEKYDMAKEVVRLIYKEKRRFLKIDATAGTWSEATWGVAREKVAHAFRKRRELDLAKAKSAKVKQKK